MGSYIYKVLPTVRKIADRDIHFAVYGYKPYGRVREDDAMRRTSRVEANEKAWANNPLGRQPLLVVHVFEGKLADGAPVLRFEGTCGTLSEHDLDRAPIGHLRKRGARWTFVPVTPEKPSC